MDIFITTLLLTHFPFSTIMKLVFKLGVEIVETVHISFFSFIWVISSMWICKKAGKPMWSQLIPLYNFAVLLEIAGFSPFLVLLLFIPFVNIGVSFFLLLVFPIYLSYSFGKDIFFGMGLIFFPLLFYPILAFSSCPYIRKEIVEEKEDNPIQEKSNEREKIEKMVCPHCGIQLEKGSKKCFLCGKKIKN